MIRCRSVLAAVALVAAASCGIRGARIDHAALARELGAVEARRTLELRVLRDPDDVAARLAIAALSEDAGRPSGAIAQLEAVLATGGPLGTRWHADDRARLARLLAARGAARVARGAPSALDDLRRARGFGAEVDDRDLARARLAVAVARLSHVDAAERAAGRALLGELAGSPGAEPAWRGARAGATPAERGVLGAWLWQRGARRAGWDELAAWHAATAPPRDAALHGAYLAALGWWTPHDAPPPPAAELVGPERCRFRGADCDPRALVERGDTAALGALAAAPPRVATSPDEAVAWLAITLGQALRGDAAWGPAFAGRVELSGIPVAQLPAGVRAAFARLASRADVPDAAAAELSGPLRLVAAAGAALGGADAGEVRAALGPLADTGDGRALLRVVTAPPATAPPAAAPPATAPPATAPPATAPPATAPPMTAADDPHAAAAVAYARARVPTGPAPAALRALVDAYARDPLIADRLVLDVVAESPDAAVAHAALGAVFDALADPARARAAWQAAVDASPEPAFLRGLAEATARAGDPDAALVAAVAAAAAAGDPAAVWIAVARELEAVGSHVHALEAARNAIDLAGPDAIAAAYDAAIAASRSLGRAAQADALAARRATVAPPPPVERAGDPTAPGPALAAYREHGSPATLAALWTAARWSPRDVVLRAALRTALPADDPRRATITAELAALAADPDPARARAAVAALRP